MKLRILSDLHLEQNYFEYSYLGEDIVVLAGDIATANTHDVFEDFIRDIPSNIKIIFITGNHEFYYGIVLKENEFYKQVSKKYENFFFLDKGHIEINHDDKLYSFFGGIMCSDFLLYGELESAKKEAKSFINDFYVSRIAHRTRWSTEDHVKEYMFFGKAFNKWIKDTTIKDSTKICISHFLPSEKSINYKFYQNRLNPYFCSNQEKRVKKVDYWIHGHCIDNESEILTTNGWKNYLTISETDKVYNFNTSKNLFEIDDINEIVKWENYCGGVYNLTSKCFDFRVSEKHNIIAKNGTGKIIYEPMDKFIERDNYRFIVSGNVETSGMQLPKRMLELYFAIVSDGTTIENKNGTVLVRFRLKKERKLIYMREILNFLNINYKEYFYKNDSCINFYLPECLFKLNIKGLDKKLINVNSDDCLEILQAYKNTDGGLNGNQICIYTSKKEEVDILQHIFTINGYKCTYSAKKSGFCDNLGYTLYVYKKTEISFQKKYNVNSYTKTNANSELFWCVSTNNGNFFMRRNGKVILTGNTHTSCDYMLENTRVICNPLGYGRENKSFDKNLIIDI